MEVAIYGGTFDPPTRAHEAIVRACLVLPGVDELWVMPSSQRYDKPGMLSDLTRLKMLRAMVQDSFADEPRLKISELELQLPPPTQTYKTFYELERRYPKNHFLYVCGVDTYEAMDGWQGGSELKRRLGMIVVQRSGYVLANLPARVQQISLAPELAELSSTIVRQSAAAGDDISKLVAPEVGAILKTVATAHASS